MPPAGGAGSRGWGKEWFSVCVGGEGLVGGRWLAGLLLELGRHSTDRCLAACGPPTCCWNCGATRVGLFGEPTILMMELLLLEPAVGTAAASVKKKKVEPSGSSVGRRSTRSDSGSTKFRSNSPDRTGPDQNHDCQRLDQSDRPIRFSF